MGKTHNLIQARELNTPSISEIIWVRNVRAIVVCGFFMKSLKKHILKIWKKSWVPFGSYLLDSTADSAQFEWKWAGLAVLFSRYLPNGTHDFFQNFRICFFKDFIKNPQTTIALTFLTHIISGIDGVLYFSGILLQKVYWIYCKKNISCDPVKPLKIGNLQKVSDL